MSRWLLGFVTLISVSAGKGVGPRLRVDHWPDTSTSSNDGVDSEIGQGVRMLNEEVGVPVENSVRADLAVLEELRTITELILRNQKKEQVPPPLPPVTHDCSTLYEAGIKASGVYSLFPFTFPVFCDMTTEGGGWTVFQRRIPQDIHEDFNRSWKDYKNGFGDLGGEFWLGLEALHQLTYSSNFELRVDLMDFELGSKYAHYEVFSVEPETDGYRLRVSGYSGNAGDALSVFHSGRKFSTYDRDQDTARNKSCAREKEGGWWFHACYAAHPNGVFPEQPERSSKGPEIRWWRDQEHVLVLTAVEMKIRRKRGHASPPSFPSSPTPRTDSEATTSSDYEEHREAEVDVDTRVDYEYRWDGGNEVFPFGDIGGDVEDDYNATEHQGRSDVSPWGVARAPNATGI